MTTVLVIRHGALGDFVLSLGAMQAIRRHHAGARLVLLTTAPFVGLARATGLFDDVLVDDRPGWTRPLALFALVRRLAALRPVRVYDLQTSDRSGLYFRLWPRPRPEWSGIARGCSHPDPDPRRDFIHTLDRQVGQLRAAGIACVPAPDVGFARDADAPPGLPARYGVIVPGGAAHRPEKRWPVEGFAAAAVHLAATGIVPVVLGAPADGDLATAIRATCPQAIDLTGRTDLPGLVAVARSAVLGLGNDTGPMHVVAACGRPALVLFSHASDPALCAPRGDRVVVIRRPDLADLAPATVLAALDELRASLTGPLGDT